MNWILVPALWLLAFALVWAFTHGAKCNEAKSEESA